MEEFILKNLKRHREGCAFRQTNYLSRSISIDDCFTIPICSTNLGYAIDIYSLNGASERARGGIMDARLLCYLAPACTLAVEDTNHSRALVCIPDFKQAAIVLDIKASGFG